MTYNNNNCHVTNNYYTTATVLQFRNHNSTHLEKISFCTQPQKSITYVLDYGDQGKGHCIIVREHLFSIYLL